MEEHSDHRNWFDRNWKWAVPAGGCLIILIIGIIFLVGMVGGITSIFKDSAPYQEAIRLAEENPEVQSAMGSPLESDGMISGNIVRSKGENSAQMSVPVKGPEGKGRIHFDAFEENDTWKFEELFVIPERTRDTIWLIRPQLSE